MNIFIIDETIPLMHSDGKYAVEYQKSIPNNSLRVYWKSFAETVAVYGQRGDKSALAAYFGHPAYEGI